MSLHATMLGGNGDADQVALMLEGLLLGHCGYALVRDTPLDRVLPWRILEF